MNGGQDGMARRREMGSGGKGRKEGGKEPRSGCVPLRRGVGEEGRAGKNPAAVVHRSAGG